MPESTLTLDKLHPFNLDPNLDGYLRELERLLRALNDEVSGSDSGGSSGGDLISSIASSIGALRSRVSDNEGRIGNDIASINGLVRSIASKSFADVEVSSNYTANDWEDIDATGAITINLPANPSVNCEVIIGNGDGKRKIIGGNGRNIKRISLSSTLTTVRKGTRLHFRYKIDKNIWVLV